MNFKRYFAGISSVVLAAGLLSFPASGDETAFFIDHFEDGNHSWTGRGAAKLQLSESNPFDGVNCLQVSGRTAAWNGAQKELDMTLFQPGGTYSFSCNAMQTAGKAEETFYMKLQYTDASGETKYDPVAEATTMKGEWVQLANSEYTVPADASKAFLYVETADGSFDFYIDNAVGAGEATIIEGPAQKKLKYGDINYDGVINIPDLCLIKAAVTEGLTDDAQKKAADVNRDKEINAEDAMLIFQYLKGEIETFPEPPVPENIWDDYQETATPQMQKFYADSIYHMGNTSRLRKKVEQAQAGEKTTVAYIGGSITEGNGLETCYAKRSYNYFAQTFGNGGNVSYVNAGLSGTSSVVGLMRAQNDILSKNADVIFIEFSVNDHPEEIYKKGFESLIKQCLSQPNDPAVVVIITRAKGGYSMQEQMVKSAKNFDVPIISMDTALTKAFESGTLKKEDYYSDEYHPHASGNALISDCISYFYRQALKTENMSDEYTIPSTSAYGSEYSTCSIVPVTELQGFNQGAFKTSKHPRFPYAYDFQKGSNNAPMTFKTTGKGIFILFKSNQNSSLGVLDVTVNGKTTSIKGNRNYAWGGPDADMAFYQPQSGELSVSMKMQNAGTDFSIWGIGVVK